MSEGKWDADSSSSGGGSGDVTGPGSSTDNAVARFDGTTGKTLQNSGVIIDDSDNMTGVTNLTVDGGLAVTNEVGIDANYGLYRVDSTALGALIGTRNTTPVNFITNDTIKANITSDGELNLGDTSATSTRLLNLSKSATATAVNFQITNGSSGQTASDGLLIGIDTAATPNAELVNFEASDLILKTNNVTAMAIDSAQNFQLYGGNGTNGGSLDITNVTTGTGSSATFDALRFLDASGAVITGPLSGYVFISMIDGTDRKTIMYRYLNTGNGTTGQVANLGDQAQTGTAPWASTAVVADGSGVKIQLTTTAGRTSVTTVVRFVGVRVE